MNYKLLGNSYACHTGGRVRLTERGVKLSLRGAPKEATVSVGARSFPLADGVAEIPADAFSTGINRVTFTVGGEVLPAESIIKTGGGLSPAGISLPDAILALDRRISALGERLAAAELSLELLLSEEGLFA
jgi:hypothetical protein